MKLFWKYSNLCDHDTLTSQTDRQTDGHMAIRFAVAIPHSRWPHTSKCNHCYVDTIIHWCHV